mgnify:FL=1
MAQNSDKKGEDVKVLFGALGIESGRYRNSVKDKDDEKAGQEAESRWPLLGELRES